jgi:alpha-beta hydrolase superfamily lysophospholipase
MFDLRGPGASPGGRGHTPFDRTMEDIAACLAEARDRVPDVPRFLYGHSLGGLLVLTYALRLKPELAGVVVSSAGLRSPVLEQQLKMTAAKLLGSTLPTIAIPSGLDDSGLSRDPAVIEAYRDDPLVHDKASFALGKDGAEGADWALAHAGDFTLPLLMLHGSDDPIAYVRGTEEVASQVSGDVTVEIYEGLLHEPHNEPEQDEVLGDIVAWLDAHAE